MDILIFKFEPTHSFVPMIIWYKSKVDDANDLQYTFCSLTIICIELIYLKFKMFKLVLIAALLGLSAAAEGDRFAEIRSSINEPSDAVGNFAYSFDTTNGISVQQAGNIAGVNGAAQWVSPEGVPIQLTYTADENGYHPSGEHLPTPPPIPEAILRALEYIRAHPPKEERKIPVQVQQYPFRG